MATNQYTRSGVEKWVSYINDYFTNQGIPGGHPMPGFENLIISIIFLGLLGLICLMSILSFKIYRQKKSEIDTAAKKEKFQEYLSFVITSHAESNYMHDYNEYDPIYLDREDLNNEKYRRLFLAELISAHLLLDGKEKELLRDLYLGFGFASEIPAKIFSNKWEDRIEALNQISAFQLTQFYPILVTCLSDSNKYVRKTAFLKYAGLKSNPIDALNYVEGKVNGWEKQIILENLKSRAHELVPIFKNFKEKYPANADFLDELTKIFSQEPEPPPISGFRKVLKIKA